MVLLVPRELLEILGSLATEAEMELRVFRESKEMQVVLDFQDLLERLDYLGLLEVRDLPV